MMEIEDARQKAIIDEATAASEEGITDDDDSTGDDDDWGEEDDEETAFESEVPEKTEPANGRVEL